MKPWELGLLAAAVAACSSVPQYREVPDGSGGHDIERPDAGGEARTDPVDASDAATVEANGGERDAEACSPGFRPCEGTCIPSAACCGPCSCDGLPKTCGPNGDENCCTSLPVTGGTFN